MVPCPWDEWPLLDAAVGYVARYPLSKPARCSGFSPGPRTAGREARPWPMDEWRIPFPMDDWTSRSGSSSMILEWLWPGGMSPWKVFRLIPPISGGPKAWASSSLNLWRLMVNQANTSRPATTTQRPITRPARAPGFWVLFRGGRISHENDARCVKICVQRARTRGCGRVDKGSRR